MAPSNTCSDCGKALESVLCCAHCGSLQQISGPQDPFLVLGLEPSFAIDSKSLDRQLLTLQRRMHPDFFSSESPEIRARAEHNTAELNSAHECLATESQRAETLLARLGGPDRESERQMPKSFLMEVLDWNEILEEGRDGDAQAAQAALDLGSELLEKRAELFAEIGRLFDPLPSPGDSTLLEIRRALNAVRYLDRALHQIEELRLENSTGK